MYSEDDSNDPITALLGQPPSLFTASHKLSDQKLFVTIFREFFLVLKLLKFTFKYLGQNFKKLILFKGVSDRLE